MNVCQADMQHTYKQVGYYDYGSRSPGFPSFRRRLRLHLFPYLVERRCLELSFFFRKVKVHRTRANGAPQPEINLELNFDDT